MFAKMLAFEWRYYTRQPSFYVTSLIFFLIAFFAMATDNVQLGSGGNVIKNGSAAIAYTFSFLSLFATFLVVNFIANTAIRNDTSGMSEILYSKPIKPFSYQLGRFTGAFLLVVTVFSMVPLGSLIGSVMPWVDSDRVGPTNLVFYVTSFFYLSVPTLFVLSCFFYAIGLKFKSLMPVYVAALGLFIFYIVGGNLMAEPSLRTAASLTDPFGVRVLGNITRYWTTVEQNTQAIELTGLLLQNRVIWIVIGLAILAAFGGFNKGLTLSSRGVEKAKLKGKAKSKSATSVSALLNNRINFKGSETGSLLKFKARTLFEVKQIMFSPPFYVLLLFSAFALISALLSPSAFYGTSSLPVTYEMVNVIIGGFGLMMIVVITYYSGEAVWRERGSGMGDIVDSMPVFNLAFWLSKLLAVCLVVASLCVTGMIVTILFQLANGFTDIDIAQYIISLFYFYALPMMMSTVLAFFIQVLSPNKFIGMLIFIAYSIGSATLTQFGFEHNLWQFSGGPMLNYSDMNGYGWYLQTQTWYMIYWGALSVVLSTLGYALWQRGPQTALKARFKLLSYQLGTSGKVTIASATLVFVLAGSYIYYNTRVLNEFWTQEQTLDAQEKYEKAFAQYLNDNVPSIIKVNAKVDIKPSQRALDAEFEIDVTNKSNAPIQRFLLNPPDKAVEWDVEIAGGTLVKSEPSDELEYKTAWFEFEQPLMPGDIRQGVIRVKRANYGFKDKNFDINIVKNGTFLSNRELLPWFGTNRGGFIADTHERRKRGLPVLERANKLEDSAHYHDSDLGKGNTFIEFEATVSTDEDQIAIAPGYLQKEWTENGKRYFHYKMDAPIANFYAFLSARLAVKKEVHNGVNVEVYYHPAHDANVDIMIESVKDSIDYFTEAFGPYQHKQMRIIEFPGYRNFAQSFANTVPYSEQIGFITDLSDEENIDPVYYVTAHEVAHQWWGHQVGAANVQGSAIISEALSQYASIMVMAKKYGDEKLRRFIKYELDRYLAGRSSERIGEMPLMRSEGQQYIHYNKGSVVMMAIKDRLGEATMNGALKAFVDEFKYQSTPYPTTLDLQRHLNAVSNDEQQRFIASLFEDIVLYDLKAEKVEVSSLENGKHQVTFTVQAKRMSADDQGIETPLALEELIDIALFSDDPENMGATDLVIYQQKHLVKEGENVFSIEVDKLPTHAGIDPFVKLIDRDSADNIIKL